MPDPTVEPEDDPGAENGFAPTKAVFSAVFHWSRPKSRYGFAAQPGDEPQSFPRDFIDAAIKAGVAQAVPARSPRPGAAAPALKQE